jgi:hypothetical protein
MAAKTWTAKLGTRNFELETRNLLEDAANWIEVHLAVPVR